MLPVRKPICLSTIVTDNAANMVKAFSLPGMESLIQWISPMMMMMMMPVMMTMMIYRKSPFQIELGRDACLDVTWYTRAIIGGPISLAAMFLLATILWEAIGSLMYLHGIYCHYSLPRKVTLVWLGISSLNANTVACVSSSRQATSNLIQHRVVYIYFISIWSKYN